MAREKMCGMETHTKQREKIQSTGLNLSSIRLEELCQSRWGCAGALRAQQHRWLSGRCSQWDTPITSAPSQKLSLRPKRVRLGFFSSPERASKPWGGGEPLRGRWGEMFPRAPRAPSAGIRGLRSRSAAASETRGARPGGCGAGILKLCFAPQQRELFPALGNVPQKSLFLW